MTTKKACNLQVDYSTVPGTRVLPFEFSLDTENSTMYPDEGQQQRFCYIIECKGKNVPLYADPEFFVLGICPSITRDQIEHLDVIIDGIPQRTVWGQDIELLTEEPDPITGSKGLKINFGLDKIAGMMQICFTLKDCYDIGPVNICAYGDGATVTGESICGPAGRLTTSCETTFYQTETVCVPVSVKPYAMPGKACAVCCGAPAVATGRATCPGTPCDECHFTVSQKLCIEIPITFGADVRTGTAVTQCGQVTESGCDCGTIITSDTVQYSE